MATHNGSKQWSQTLVANNVGKQWQRLDADTPALWYYKTSRPHGVAHYCQQRDTELQDDQFIWLRRSPTIEISAAQMQAFRRRARFTRRAY
jgi:hypothetical protein